MISISGSFSRTFIRGAGFAFYGYGVRNKMTTKIPMDIVALNLPLFL
jgi:hypothetical protein